MEEEWKIVININGEIEITNCETATTHYLDDIGLAIYNCNGLKELLRGI